MCDLYSNLNRKNVKKIRKTQPKMVVPKTDISHFEKISTDRVETIISNTIKIKENEIQEWIDQEDPGPFEILKRISEISLAHHSLLSKIIPELENIIMTPQPPVEINNSRSKNHKKHFIFSSSSSSSSSINSTQPDKPAVKNNDFNQIDSNFNNISNFENNHNSQINEDDEKYDIQQYLNYDPYTNSYALSKSKQRKDDLSQILIEMHDYNNLIANKKEKIKELKKLLEEKKKEKEQLEHEYGDFQFLLKNEKFGAYEIMKKEKEEKEEIQNFTKNEKIKQKNQAEYSQIYGESRRLKEEIQRLTKDVNANHKFQLSFAHDTNLKRIEAEIKKKEEEEQNE